MKEFRRRRLLLAGQLARGPNCSLCAAAARSPSKAAQQWQPWRGRPCPAARPAGLPPGARTASANLRLGKHALARTLARPSTRRSSLVGGLTPPLLWPVWRPSGRRALVSSDNTKLPVGRPAGQASRAALIRPPHSQVAGRPPGYGFPRSRRRCQLRDQQGVKFER